MFNEIKLKDEHDDSRENTTLLDSKVSGRASGMHEPLPNYPLNSHLPNILINTQRSTLVTFISLLTLLRPQARKDIFKAESDAMVERAAAATAASAAALSPQVVRLVSM